MNRILGLFRSRVGRVGIAAGVVSAAVLGFAAPAYAHHSVLTGSTECFDGDHLVNWSIQAVSVVHLPMTIASANATIGGVTYPVTGYTPTIDDGETTHATTTVPAGTTGTITLHVHSTWPDGVTFDDHTSVDLITDCHTTTTETTTTSTTTTTTLPTTTTIGEQGSTTTTQPPCTESTTTTIGEQGSTTTTPPSCTESTTTTIGEQGSTTTEAPTTTTEAPTTTTQPPCIESTTTTTLGEEVSTSVPVTVPETTGPTTTTQPMCNESTTTTEATTTTTFGEQGSTSVPVTVPETTSPTTPPTTGPNGATTTLVQQDTPTSAPGAVTGQLPRTGNNSGFPLALGAGCLAAGGLLALRRRKAWSR